MKAAKVANKSTLKFNKDCLIDTAFCVNQVMDYHANTLLLQYSTKTQKQYLYYVTSIVLFYTSFW